MLELLNSEKAKNQLSEEILRRNKFLFEWIELSFEQKQMIRLAAIEDYEHQLPKEKGMDANTIDRLVSGNKKNLHFNLDLFLNQPIRHSEFFFLFNISRCFAMTFLAREEVYIFMKKLAISENINQEVINEMTKLHEHVKMNRTGKTGMHRFTIKDNDLNFFNLDRFAVIQSLDEIGYNEYSLESAKDEIVFTFKKDRRQLPLIKLKRIGNKHRFTILDCLGTFSREE